MQMASPGVIAKPRPLGQDRIEFRTRQRANMGETRHEPFVVRYHRCDLSLLQHNFRDPDPIRIPITLPGQITSTFTPMPT